ncbi:MAG TPA: methyltransferase domain-containing protein [Anaerolineae bacterium]|jgi:ubiquinone/menaquinone biosynthesis C-methylase UbiE|nr:methyltransferase domain-containing protein [Anaerolineae bacterium]
MISPLLIDALETNEEIKACCAAVYESDWARLLLGDSFHPGGPILTERLGSLMELGPNSRVLDVAAGTGGSALFLAERFGCEVVGIDYSRESVALANAAAAEAGLAGRVRFELGDAEQLPFDNGSFDAVICECAFCTFPDKTKAAAEIARVLRPSGRLGLSDLTRSGSLPAELEGLLAWIACIADAQPVDRYVEYLASAGLTVNQVETHDEALSQTVSDVRARLLGAELLVKLKKIDLPGADFEQARIIARSAAEAIRDGKLGYALLLAK